MKALIKELSKEESDQYKVAKEVAWRWMISILIYVEKNIIIRFKRQIPVLKDTFYEKWTGKNWTMKGFKLQKKLTLPYW